MSAITAAVIEAQRQRAVPGLAPSSLDRLSIDIIDIIDIDGGRIGAGMRQRRSHRRRDSGS